MADKETAAAKPQSLLLPVGWAPWLVALAGFGMGADNATDIVKRSGTYETAGGDLLVIQSGLISAALYAAVFVGGRTIWRWIRRRDSLRAEGTRMSVKRWNTLGIGIACAVIAFAFNFYQRWPQIVTEPWTYYVGSVLGAILFGGIGAAISAIRNRIKRAT